MTDPRQEGDSPVQGLVAWLRDTVAPGAALVADSRAVRPGDVFVAMPGRVGDGRRHIGAAVAAGAAAVLSEAGGGFGEPGVPHLEVEGLAALAGRLAAQWYGDPSSRLKVVAVTGTNGKTSCTQWIARGMAEWGRRAAVIGTLGSGIVEPGEAGASLQSFGLTTPDALSLQRMLAAFVDAGVEVVAMEASSIGIDQGRIDGLRVDVAVFTNFSRDHLDYHGDERAYLGAKLRLFAWPGLRVAIVNGDDPIAPVVIDTVAEGVQTVAFGQLPGEHGWRARKKLSAWQINEGASAMDVSIGGDYGRAQIEFSVLGRFNVVNATAVAATWIALGMPFDEAMRRLHSLQPIPGRMQRIEAPGAPLVVVDYAHTPDALMSVLQALRPVATARGGYLWCVFGAGGDRDTGKRPLMGLVAERNADRVVITSDNPRSETPFRIASDIRAGLTREPWLTELDRREAIARTLAIASPADVVLVAGKGHENYQEIAGVRHPYSDIDTVRELLGLRESAGEHADV
ncbi:UDP-N-acetylmuramoyl-L-alanyl-D-glutamate--2,6-diaminopimelate ligase [Burkholderiaceae bacterium FT117]|uniref:UDP-N-acetylmuramoyl-L-alanyl-D-glutamate--2, 6-diaminopimelate ligase n=1 Tax=Zeimonas sediminis TaxID=2944268 RepID=UPI002342F12E|nr:UDP-N-acetylmuramoyl-L-alanyl-D-glutamate--2,6-diaminopimelate ligase [Zeimonas sediminis]MCM5570788.1 UDP-N-acetylmuramoyl-L-alanyl-D-glutamate--2,6-diaminopimelate ligase [Zeimonas sediminis]